MQNRFYRIVLLLVPLLLGALSMQAQQMIPKCGDSYWQDSIPSSMRQDYVHFGTQYLGKPWYDLPTSVFAEFKKNGNRTNYESLMFKKRRQLSALVMAEIMEGKGRFLPDIVKGIQSTLKETWWGLPAHYDSDAPRTDYQLVDLFNAETASLLAYTRYMLASQLDSLSPSLSERIDSEISRRILQPAVTEDYWWKKVSNNWNTWICSNWLACVLFCDHDEDRKVEAIRQINSACVAFVEGYPDDGGCDEGPMYWDRSAASLFEVSYLLRMYQYQPAIDYYHPKMRSLSSYIYKMYAGDGYVVNFSDNYGYRVYLNINIAYPFGLFTGDKMLCQFAAWIGQQNDEINKSAQLFNSSGNWPSLGRELVFLCHIQSFLKEQPKEPLLKNAWLPNLQIMTFRKDTPSSSLFVAIKGGHNGENHNHNDVGSFIVYANGEPVLIDLGVASYSAKTFSDKRYELWTMQSDYHNLPRINGYSQHAGKKYKATVVKQRDGLLTLDLSKAYPEEASVDKWERTVTASSRHKIRVKEAFVLSSFKEPSQLMFITPFLPVIVGDGHIKLNGASIHFKPSQLSYEIEDVSSLIDSSLSQVWGGSMYRIVLSVRSNYLKQSIRYTISVD